MAVEVFSGNTSDSKTVTDKIDEIQKTYGVTDFVFVGDRGMLTQKNIDARPNTLSVTGLTHAGIKALCEHETVQFSLFDEDIGTEVILPEEPNVRYILRKNPILKRIFQNLNSLKLRHHKGLRLFFRFNCSHKLERLTLDNSVII